MNEEKQWFQKGSPHPIPKEVCEAHKTPSPQTVEEIGNLKINFARMEEKLDNLIKLVNEHIVEHKKDSAEMKATMEPVTKFLETMSNNRKGLIWTGVTMASLGGIFGGFKAVYHFFID
jgi:hypothetical protein